MIPFADVNILSVLGATVACMALGFTWYSPKMFGTKWMKLTGITHDSVSKKDMKKGMKIGLLATFLNMYFLAVLLLMLQVSSVPQAIIVSSLLWAATVLPGELHGVAWEKRSMELLYINASNALVTYGLGATVLVWWPF